MPKVKILLVANLHEKHYVLIITLKLNYKDKLTVITQTLWADPPG